MEQMPGGLAVTTRKKDPSPRMNTEQTFNHCHCLAVKSRFKAETQHIQQRGERNMTMKGEKGEKDPRWSNVGRVDRWLGSFQETETNSRRLVS